MEPQTATAPANPITDQPSTRPAATRADGVQPIGKILNGFERYLPKPEEPKPPPTAEQIARDERIRQAENRAIDEQLAASKQRQIDSLLAQGGPRFADATLASYVATSAIQKQVVAALKKYLARDWLNEDDRNLVFFGPVGTGKDHLAFAVALEEARHGLSVIWMNVQEWFGDLRDRMDANDSRSEHQEISRLAESEILVLSEVLPPFGAIGQHMATMLYRVVEKRTARGVATFCTLNAANDKEAAERMGRPTWDRLCDNAGKMFCDWPSYRAPAWRVNC